MPAHHSTQPVATGATTYGVLGPVEAHRDGELLRVGGGKARAILAMLALEPGRVVPTGRLIDGVWGDDPPMGVQATLQVHVSNLRKALGAAAVVTRAPGYLLAAEPSQVDLGVFDAGLSAARAERDAGRTGEARQRYLDALALWRGSPLSDVADAPFTQATVPWLVERRVQAVEEASELALVLGDHGAAVTELELALQQAPHRERLWAQLMLALYRSGRQADALGTYQRARRTLGEDLGIEPGSELRRLEAAVLAQDPGLDLPEPTPVTRPDDGADGDDGDGDATYRLVVQVGCRFELESGTEIPLSGLAVIGRHVDCDITLPDPAISRRHAEVRPALGGYLLVDLGSTNGTLVNDAPAVHHVLADGDVVRIGAHVLRYRSDPAVPASNGL